MGSESVQVSLYYFYFIMFQAYTKIIYICFLLVKNPHKVPYINELIMEI